jgi:predicted oxidoreductase (fatty acid repression mutant protein)
MEQPTVAPGHWITVNSGSIHSWNAVVCSLNPVSSKYSDSIEVVYLENKPHKEPSKRKALGTYVVWKDGKWQRAFSSPKEAYADNYPRFAEYVKILRRGRY